MVAGQVPRCFFRQWWKLGSSCRGPGKHPEAIRKFLGSAVPLLGVRQLVLLRSGPERMCASNVQGRGGLNITWGDTHNLLPAEVILVPFQKGSGGPDYLCLSSSSSLHSFVKRSASLLILV